MGSFHQLTLHTLDGHILGAGYLTGLALSFFFAMLLDDQLPLLLMDKLQRVMPLLLFTLSLLLGPGNQYLALLLLLGMELLNRLLLRLPQLPLFLPPSLLSLVKVHGSVCLSP